MLTRGAGRTPPPRIADPSEKIAIFPVRDFIAMRALSWDHDHVRVETDSGIIECAVGHLAMPTLAAMRGPHGFHATLADAGRRTILGIPSDEVIDHVLHGAPYICPVALALVRANAPDPTYTLAECAKSALRGGTVLGKEATVCGQELRYEMQDGLVTAIIEGEDWKIECNWVRVRALLPDTVRNAAVGRPLATLIDHPAFRDSGATVSEVKTDSRGTWFAFETEAVALKSLPEYPGSGKKR